MFRIQKFRRGEWRDTPIEQSRKRAADTRLARLRKKFPQNQWRVAERPEPRQSATLIRAAAGSRPHAQLARDFGVSLHTISAVVTGRLWSTT